MLHLFVSIFVVIADLQVSFGESKANAPPQGGVTGTHLSRFVPSASLE